MNAALLRLYAGLLLLSGAATRGATVLRAANATWNATMPNEVANATTNDDLTLKVGVGVAVGCSFVCCLHVLWGLYTDDDGPLRRGR